jgi:pyridoxamine 5'-phosphate oxidase-like protein
VAYREVVARPIATADIAAHLEEFGALATLVTVTPDATPHVGTVLVTAGRTRLEIRVGSRTRDHIRANPSVSLTWLPDGSRYQLIVDGIAVVVDEPDADGLYLAEVDVRQGILHRTAGQTEGPTCRPLGHAATGTAAV